MLKTNAETNANTNNEIIKIKQSKISKEIISFKEIIKNGVVIENTLLNNMINNLDTFNKIQLIKLNKNKCMEEIKNKNKNQIN